MDMRQEPFVYREGRGQSPRHGRRWLSAQSRLFALSIAIVLLASASVTVAAQGTRSGPLMGAMPDGGIQDGRIQYGSALAQAAEFDQQFIDMMVPHHEGAVEMAKVAQQRSQRPEILALATNIIASQDAEIGQMRAWRQAWYGSSETPPMSQMPMLHEGSAGQAMMAMNMAEEVEALRNAAEPFDRAFIDAMIPHHESAIEAARMAQQRAVHKEIRDLAVAIIADQQREIDQMRQWRQAWFGSADTPQPSHMPGMGH